jgi:putative membrane protein
MNRTRIEGAAALLGVALLLVSSMAALAQKGKTAKPRVDKTFLMKAAEGGMAEVELGRLAVRKASSPAVKQFGQHMVDDHGKANEELKGLAQSKGVALPKSVGAKNKATLAKLEKLNGAAFDRTYMSDMVKDHKEDVAEFRHESTRGADPDAKAWAGKTLPTLESHLKMAMDTQKELSAGSKKAGRSAKPMPAHK